MNKNGGKMMNTKGLWMVVVLFLLLSVTGVLCWDFKTNQHLGTPGVRIVAGNLYNEKSELVRTNIVELPLVVPGFRSEPLPLNTREQEWLPDDTLYGRRRYFSLTDSFFGDLNVVVMERDRTSIHKPQYCLPAGGFHITSEETIELQVTLEDGTQLQAQLIRASREMEIKPGEKRVVNAMFIYYFVADGQTTPNHLDMMWRMGTDLLLHGVTERWGYVSFLAWHYPGQEKQTLERCKEFLKVAVPEFQLPVRS